MSCASKESRVRKRWKGRIGKTKANLDEVFEAVRNGRTPLSPASDVGELALLKGQDRVVPALVLRVVLESLQTLAELRRLEGQEGFDSIVDAVVLVEEFNLVLLPPKPPVEYAKSQYLQGSTGGR
jgi:hypothetical protein